MLISVEERIPSRAEESDIRYSGFENWDSGIGKQRQEEGIRWE